LRWYSQVAQEASAAAARVKAQLESRGVKNKAAVETGKTTPEIRDQECQNALRMVFSLRKGANNFSIWAEVLSVKKMTKNISISSGLAQQATPVSCRKSPQQ
jgi:hypothetical protein